MRPSIIFEESWHGNPTRPRFDELQAQLRAVQKDSDDEKQRTKDLRGRLPSESWVLYTPPSHEASANLTAMQEMLSASLGACGQGTFLEP